MSSARKKAKVIVKSMTQEQKEMFLKGEYSIEVYSDDGSQVPIPKILLEMEKILKGKG